MKTFEKIVFAFCVLSVASFVASYTGLGCLLFLLFLVLLIIRLLLPFLLAPLPFEREKEEIVINILVNTKSESKPKQD